MAAVTCVTNALHSRAATLATWLTTTRQSHFHMGGGGGGKGATSDFCYDRIKIGVLSSRRVFSPGAENEMDRSGTEAIGTRCNFRMQSQHSLACC